MTGPKAHSGAQATVSHEAEAGSLCLVFLVAQVQTGYAFRYDSVAGMGKLVRLVKGSVRSTRYKSTAAAILEKENCITGELASAWPVCWSQAAREDTG